MIDIEQRITAAIERITSGNAPMRVPADETDPDLVLADCLAEIRRLRAALAARQPVESEENVAADTYWTLAEMIEPHVQREGINPDGALPASVHDSVAILLEHWLRTRQPVGEPVELSPEFTDTARAAIAWVLWHHQGGSSAVGQPLRFALGMGQHDRMTDQQIAEAKRFATWAGVSSEGFQHRSPALAVDHQAALLAEERSHSETIDQRDRCEEVADELADHIARITGVDIGEHSSANCPWQNAIDAAEEYKPAQAVDLGQFRPFVEAQRNEYISHGLTSENASVAECDELLALIDSKADGNG